MELKEAINIINNFRTWYMGGDISNDVLQEIYKSIDTILEELNNRISKDDLKNILRKVQDYQLNYKDTVLFNIIMQEIFGETEWTNLENKE